jgi:multiple sugar transport system ATP-binding protein
MPDLRLLNINKSYGALQVVKGISLDVPAGEFVVLVGASGCGKSTLLRSIAGLEEISDGDIQLGGRSIARLSPRDRNIAMVFQSYALYPYLTVYENVAFGLRARKFSNAEVERKVAWAVDVLGIGDYLKRFPRELSGGQRQRVAIGRAIVRDADLYLFDEPLSNLDAKLRDGMREEIKRLHERLRKTFIYVTHDQIEAMTLAQRIVLLRDGKIEQSGAPLDLFEKPDNMFVGGFLGSPPMNFIDVNVAKGRMTLPDGQILACKAGVRDGGYLWGVRPEHWARAATKDQLIRVKPDVIQPTGSRSYCTFFLAGTRVVAELEAAAAGQGMLALPLRVSMERTAFFDKTSARRVA